MDAAGKAVPLSRLKPKSAMGVREDTSPIEFPDKTFDDGVRTWASADVVYAIGGKGFVRLQASVGLDKRCYTSEINSNVRFFVFDQAPDMDELVPVTGPTPAALPPVLRTKEETRVNGCSVTRRGELPSAAEK